MNRILVALVGVALVATPAFAQDPPPLKERMAQFNFMWERLGQDKRTIRSDGCREAVCLQTRKLLMDDGDIVIGIVSLGREGNINRALCFGNKAKQPVPICMEMLSGKMFSFGELKQ